MAIEISSRKFTAMKEIKQRLQNSLQKESPPQPLQDEDETKPIELLALPPVSEPVTGDASFLKKIAYNESFETHPLQGVVEILFVKGGTIPAEEVGNLKLPASELTGMIETTHEGDIISEAIRKELDVHRQMHDVFVAPPKRFPQENLSLKAMRVVRRSSYAAD